MSEKLERLKSLLKELEIADARWKKAENHHRLYHEDCEMDFPFEEKEDGDDQ